VSAVPDQRLMENQVGQIYTRINKIFCNSSGYFVFYSFPPYQSGTVIFPTLPCRVRTICEQDF